MDSERVTEEANTTCFHPQSCSSGWGAISHLRLQRRNIDFCNWECNWAFAFTCKSLLLCCSYPGCSEPMGVEIDGCEQDEVEESRVLYSSACCSKVVHESLSTPNYLILHITVKITFSKPKALIRSTCPSWKSITLRLKTQVLNTASRVYNGLSSSGLLSYHTFHLLHSIATLVFLTHRLCTCPSLIHSANISGGIIIC